MSCLRIFGAILIGLLVPISSAIASDVVINEFQIDPSTLQWVELYNNGSSSVDISGWIIDDNGSPSTKYTIADNTMLPSHTCLVFTSGNFNFNISSADSARLLAGETVLDSYAYPKSPGSNTSFLRLPDGVGEWATASATPGSFNSGGDPCLPPTTPTPTIIPTPTSSPTNTPQPTATPTSSPTATSKPTATHVPSPTRAIAFDILGIDATASKEGTISEAVATNNGGNAASFARTRPWVFAFLFIGTGLGLLAFALTIQKIDVWKKLQKPSSSTGHQ